MERQCQGIFSSSCSLPSRCVHVPTIPHAAPGPETPTPWHTGLVCYARFWHRAYSPRMPHFSAAGGLDARADDVRGGGRVAAAAAVSPTAKPRAAAARAPVLCSTQSYCGLQPWSAATTCVRAVARRMRARMDRSCRSTGAARCRRCSPRRHARMRMHVQQRQSHSWAGGAVRVQAEPARVKQSPQHTAEAVSFRMPASRTRCGRAGAACAALHRAARRFAVS